MSKTFLKNLVYNNVSQGLQFGSRWVFNLILIILLSDVKFGIFAYALALSNILMSILPFGSPIYLIGFLNVNNKNRELADSLAIVIFLFLGFLLLYLVLLPFKIEHYSILFYALVLGLVYSINTVLYFYLKSLGKFLQEIKASFLSFSLIMIFIGYYYFLDRNVSHLSHIFIGLIIINCVVCVYIFTFNKVFETKNIFNELPHSIRNFKTILKTRMYYGLQEVMTASYSQLGVFILFYFLTEERYGVFRKLYIIIAPVYLLSVTFSQVLLHHLKKYNGKKAIAEFRKYQRYTFFGAFTVATGLFFFRKPLLEFLGKLTLSTEVLNAFLLVIFISFIRFIYGNYEMLLVKLNKQHLRFWILVVAVVANIGSMFLLVPLFGLIGAVLTDVIANVVVLLGVVWLAEKNVKTIFK